MRVAVGLSGGVDSAVAAALLLRAGHEVVGITMKIWDGALEVAEGAKHACYGPGEEEDVAACERLAAALGIEYRTFDLCDEYSARVLDYFRAEYEAGRTPNPCVRCNTELKFGFLLERARAAGLAFDRFATGHYARILDRGGRPSLARALDPRKDQSYFIYRLAPELLGGLLFPLGDMDKAGVREEARRLGLEVADKPESQDFIAGGDYAPLFGGRDYPPGDIVDRAGRVLGRHAGIVHYTVGQRRGLGVASNEPLYVERIDAAANRIVVGNDASLFTQEITLAELFLNPARAEGETFRCRARIRQNHREQDAIVEVQGGGRALLRFEAPVRAAAPGQSAVFYEGDFVAGGGIIQAARPLA